jgi:hypothetical protein
MVKYLTDDEAVELPDEEEATIEKSIMSLLSATPLPIPNQEVDQLHDQLYEDVTDLDTDGPNGYSDDRTLLCGMCTFSILLSTTTVVIMYLSSMGAYTYPLWT